MSHKPIWYRQCSLLRGSPDGGETRLVVWIPESLAKKDQYVVLKEDDTVWIVEAVWSRCTEEYLLEHERDYVHHRKRTDI